MMRKPLLGVVAVLLTASCNAVGTLLPQDGRRQPKFDFDVTLVDEELDEVEFDDGVTSVDVPVERERVQARFAFGGTTRGLFQVFAEEFQFGPVSIDAVGLGGGVKAAPRLNEEESAVGLLLPWGASLSIVVGEEDDPVLDDPLLVYAELLVDVGLAGEWQGLRAGGGVQLSSLAGAIDSTTLGDPDLSGVNLGPYVEVLYKHPDFPLYGRFRSVFGDLDRQEFSVGVQF